MRWAVKWYCNLEWHRWFAWHPIEIDRTWIWLEYVERKQRVTNIGYKQIYFWWYRIIGTEGPADVPAHPPYPPRPPRPPRKRQP